MFGSFRLRCHEKKQRGTDLLERVVKHVSYVMFEQKKITIGNCIMLCACISLNDNLMLWSRLKTGK